MNGLANGGGGAALQRWEDEGGLYAVDGPTDGDRAFEMLRDHSQHNGRKLSDVAAAVVESHRLVRPPPPAQAQMPGEAGEVAVL